MIKGYFHRVAKETPTKVWVNNPRGSEIQKSIDAGAVCCTTNPAYCSKVIQLESDYLNDVIDSVIRESENNDSAAEHVYQTVTKRILDAFLPIYEESDGAFGYVTMQGDPRLDKDPKAIVAEAFRCRNLGPNFMAKIPVTKAGIDALERVVEQNVPICATEIFSVSQAVHMCEVYERASKRSGNQPPFYVTHITGILDQLFQNTVQSEGIDISSGALAQAGCIIARKEYSIMKERGYPGIFLGGGARGLEHFTEMVGGDLAVTLNWSTMQELIETDGPVEFRIDVQAPKNVIDELCEKLPNFRRAYEEGALSVEEYEDFGPVALFRTMFLNGYARLLDAVADRRLILSEVN
jgi:transaldolase